MHYVAIRRVRRGASHASCVKQYVLLLVGGSGVFVMLALFSQLVAVAIFHQQSFEAG